LVGLVMAGLIAAVMGHTSGAINSVTTIATIDFYLPWKQWRAARSEALLRIASAGAAGAPHELDYASPLPPPRLPPPPPQADTSPEADRQAVRFGRFFGVLAIIAGVICAELLTQHSKKPIFLYLLNAYGYFTPGIATMFLLGILWKRTTTAGALTAGALTIPLSLVLQWSFPELAFQNRTGIVFWSCMIACVVVSLLTPAAPDEQLKGLIWTVDSLKMPREQREKYRGLRRPVLWWAIITAVVVYFYIRYA
jgi:SSS family solute:Na+ symporter